MVPTATVSASANRGRQVPEAWRPAGSAHDTTNVGDIERMISVVGGGWLLLEGLRQGNLAGLGLAALGGGLACRGVTGHCSVYSALDVSSAAAHGRLAAVPAGKGFKVIRAVTINRSPEVLYRRWRDLENLPRWMSHLVSVNSQGNQSHWVARAPAGMNAEWDAEIIKDEPDRVIAWRSLEGSRVSTAGSVHFISLSNNRGTEVQVTLKYDPPGGALGSWLAWLFGEEPGQQIREDLRRFKSLMEVGETPTVRGQPSGRESV